LATRTRMSDLRLVTALALALCACNADVEEANVAVSNISVEPAQAPSEAEPTNAATPVSPARTSIFTELDMAKCRLVEEEKEEGPYWLRRCPGHAGWQLDWSESDSRQGLSLIPPSGQDTELRLSDLVAKGAFNSIAKTIEWRGADAAKPEALIFRMNVASGAEPQRPDISRLGVVRLTSKPCLAGVVEPGPGQNEKARNIADGSMADCVRS
jgi:hypothetical protein